MTDDLTLEGNLTTQIEADLYSERYPQFVLTELSDADIHAGAEKLDLDNDTARALMTRGINTLASRQIAEINVYTNQEPDPEEIEVMTPHAIDISNLSYKHGGVFFTTDVMSVIEFMEDYEGVVKLYYDNEIREEGAWLDNFSDEVLRINFDAEGYPHTDRAYFFVFKKEGEISAIIPFINNNIDIDVTSEIEKGPITRILLRPTKGAMDIPTREKLMELAKDLNAMIPDIKKQLNLSEEILLDLILDSDRSPKAYAFKYEGDHGEARNLIHISEGKLGWYGKRENINRMLRHEYLHLVDGALGRPGTTFSTLFALDIIRIIKNHLPSLEINLSEDGSSLLKRGDNPVGMFFSENGILDRGRFMSGHAGDNMTELFTSAMNVAFDADRQEDLEAVNPERARWKLIAAGYSSDITLDFARDEWVRVHNAIYDDLVEFIKNKAIQQGGERI